jgi:hypothetical protein
MIRIHNGAFTLLYVLVVASNAAGSPVIAQYTAPNNGNIAGFSGSLPSYIPAQTFTTTGGGVVDDVTVSLTANGPLPSYVLVEIRTVSGGLPTSTVLGSASILSPALIGSPQDFTADFSSSGVTLSPFTSYALAFQTDGGAWVCGEFNGTYSGGMTAQSFDTGSTFSPTFFSHDLQFTVTAVPEPASAALLAAACCALTVFRRTGRNISRRPPAGV